MTVFFLLTRTRMPRSSPPFVLDSRKIEQIEVRPIFDAVLDQSLHLPTAFGSDHRRTASETDGMLQPGPLSVPPLMIKRLF